MATTYTPSHRTKKSPPRLSHGLPYLGHALEFARDPVGLLHKGRQQFGDIFSFSLMGKQVTVLTGPNANQAFFKAPDNQLSAREAYKFTIPIFGKGIAYDASPEIMSEQISFVFPAMREERMRTYAQFMTEEAQAYFDSWGNSGEIDLLCACNELTIFIAGRCLIGEEFRTHLTTEFAQLYHDIEGALHLLGFFWPYLPLPSFQRRDKARIRMVELIAEIVANRRNQGIETEDFLQTLIAAQYSDGTALSEDNITGLLLTLLFAGQHTSAVLAAWTGILLLQHPQHLPAILQEQQQVFGENPEISLSALGQLSHLESAIREAERMRPPLVMLMRQILEDFEYEDYMMPAGGLVMVSSAVSHRIPDVFPNPDRYDPSRFAPGREEHRQHRYALIGFGGGRHRCIGEAFAYQQVKVIWSILLQHFDLELVQASYEPNYTTWVVGPRQPCLVRYQRK
ncbi:MAG: cytochrome P450 [Coleofasciculus sp. G1-WW12-02]|uniref:cytochrome P450 n=1 Tax=Coleofasciculus sp. G1-WW12-02 TaxID=3068483 RepID=UPI0032F454A0